jgi:hypothetical protein
LPSLQGSQDLALTRQRRRLNPESDVPVIITSPLKRRGSVIRLNEQYQVERHGAEPPKRSALSSRSGSSCSTTTIPRNAAAPATRPTNSSANHVPGCASRE